LKEIEKNIMVLAAFSVIFGIICVFLIFICDNNIAQSSIAVLFVLIEIYVLVHFRSIKYTVSEELFIKKSGIVFKKTKTVPLDKIVMKSVFSVGKTVFFTLIRTSGSISVIFGEF